MSKNMGKADRLIRIVLAIAVAGLYLTGHIAGLPAIVLGIIAAAFMLTSAIGWCPVYVPLGLSTCSNKKPMHKQK